MLLACKFQQSENLFPAYRIIRVVLHIWDVLPDEIKSGTTDQPPQPAQELGELGSLLTLLEWILKAFEVADLGVLDSMLG